MGIGRATGLALALVAGSVGLAAFDPAPSRPGLAASGDATPTDPPPGQLLIASAQIQDPRFHHTVILILRHDKAGALGIVVNRAVGNETVANLLAAAGDADSSVDGSVPVHAGGPVQPELGFLVHSAEYRRADTLTVDGKVAMTASREALKDIGHHKGPARFFFALGYAGWGAGQLEHEIERKDWFTATEEPDLVFAEDSGTVWDRALARHQQEL
ncbi:MAG: YqgE/AlgH family protein [Alphaproteobacteria bacterium]|nr:YqgE/AlgH family protein [Alphaproteobacteria bacterium]